MTGLGLKPGNICAMILQIPARAALLPVLWLALTAVGHAGGTLHGPQRIQSEALGYDLQYWVYLPESGGPGLPELYVTDGQAYLLGGSMVGVLDREISSGRIAPLAVVFVDSRDPDRPEHDRRNEQFMCNAEYGQFFLGELMPEISSRWTKAGPGTRRGLQGVSFGAINAGCFGLMMPGVFELLILNSPAGAEHVDVLRQRYESEPRHPSAVLVSHGGRRDNDAAARRLVGVLQRKGYSTRHLSGAGAHDWENWGELIDDGLRAFVGLQEGDRLEPCRD